MWMKYTSKEKRRFIFAKIFIFVSIILMCMLAAHITKVELPTFNEKLSFGIGVIMVGMVGLLATLNRLKVIFKIRSIGFIVTFVILLLLKSTIDYLIWSIGLVLIPLLIDDTIFKFYFKYLDMKYM